MLYCSFQWRHFAQGAFTGLLAWQNKLIHIGIPKSSPQIHHL
ncbi:hypothetical protein [Algoriphagus halophilus]